MNLCYNEGNVFKQGGDLMDSERFLGEFIKFHRKKQHLNISQMAYKTKYSRSYLVLIEAGKVIQSDMKQQLIRFFQVLI